MKMLRAPSLRLVCTAIILNGANGFSPAYGVGLAFRNTCSPVKPGTIFCCRPLLQHQMPLRGVSFAAPLLRVPLSHQLYFQEAAG